MVKFEIGKTYATSSICDHNCIYEFKILRRTTKSIWVKVYGEIKRRKITIYENREEFFPFGHYSMCAVINAEKEK